MSPQIGYSIKATKGGIVLANADPYTSDTRAVYDSVKGLLTSGFTVCVTKYTYGVNPSGIPSQEQLTLVALKSEVAALRPANSVEDKVI